MLQLLIDQPLLLLFLVAAIGYALGRITIAGTSLGVAAVLFVGLAFGALDPDLKLPDLIYQLGLVVFVYTIGLSSGRQFFASLRRKGLRDNLLVLVLLLGALLLTLAIARLLGLSPGVAAGLFTGSLTNTAALAAVLQYVNDTAAASDLERLLAEPVVGFSITYPMGVIGMIIVIAILRSLWRIDYEREAERAASGGMGAQQLERRTIAVTHAAVTQQPIEQLVAQAGRNVVFSRVRHDDHLALATGETQLAVGDLVTVIGPRADVDAVTDLIGTPVDQDLQADRREFDYRRMFVSRPELAGRRLRDLRLPQRFGAFVTRIRRGDSDMVAHGDSVLELGDRVRVVARPEQMGTVSAFFGDSYRALSEIDILSFNLGLALGLLVGMIPIPLPGGFTVNLGFAGGPLIVALVLGALHRTGRLVWNIPYSANLTLRQIGLILFLAGVGTRSGFAFVSTLREGNGLPIFLAGIVITVSFALLTLVIGYRLLRIPWGLLLGMLAGVQTQPALLGYALEQTHDDLPNIGYAAVYPVALIGKIVLAQIVLLLLS
jgi:putative transport protein